MDKFVNNLLNMSGLNKDDPHKFIGVALLEKMCHWAWSLRFQKAHAKPRASLLAIAPVPVYCHVSCRDDNGLNLGHGVTTVE